MAQSRCAGTSCCLSAFGVKRTSRSAAQWVSDALDDDDLQFACAVLLAMRGGLKVLGRFVAGDRLLEARKLDDDEAVEFLRAFEDLELAAPRQELAVELRDDRRRQIGVLLVLLGVVDLRARDPISDHLILHANREHHWQTRANAILAARFAIVMREQFGPCRTVLD